MADAQTEQVAWWVLFNLQVSIHSLLLSPDPELPSMKGQHGKQLMDIHGDSGTSACVPQQGLLNLSAGEQENPWSRSHFQSDSTS